MCNHAEDSILNIQHDLTYPYQKCTLKKKNAHSKSQMPSKIFLKRHSRKIQQAGEHALESRDVERSKYSPICLLRQEVHMFSSFQNRKETNKLKKKGRGGMD